MKKIFALMALSLMTNSFAGEIVNRKTGEKIILGYDESTKEVSIDAQMKNGEIRRTVEVTQFEKQRDMYRDLILHGKKTVDGEIHDKQNLFSKTSEIIGASGEIAEELGIVPMIPISLVVVPVFFATDVVLLPVTLPIKLVAKSKAKNDLKKIALAIGTDESIEVRPKVFKRILNYLPLIID